MTRILCIACNIGVFGKSQEPCEQVVAKTIEALCQQISLSDASFVAVHFQEAKYAVNVLRPLISHPALGQYSAKHVVSNNVWDDTGGPGLCSLYMHIPTAITATVQPLGEKIDTETTEAAISEGAEHIPVGHALSYKLPKEMLPYPASFKQKGLLYTCWLIQGKPWGFINVHLPQEDNNWRCIAQQPSPAAHNRYAALSWVLKQCNVTPTDCTLVFGDFNFRPCLRGVMQTIYGAALDGNGRKIVELVDDHDKVAPVVDGLMPPEAEVLIVNAALAQHAASVSEKAFHAGDVVGSFQLPATANPLWEHDEGRKLESFLVEPPLNFPPSYGYGSVEDGQVVWMTKRCPAWTDRIFMTPEAMSQLQIEAYDIVGGINTAIRDHKPVYLVANIS
uniref:inositol-polyphosphate 5-phosphatase n=1 Tax=Eutreptiella gymnastica TaxID=73025 RepID=A0A7S1NP69_9EUGL|mmetsp:Transcript_66525/g.118113  ORF Transcript_66525/g.118113 Transcript_66525/m.118113 type:complete len:391 (+) Transcript_66525:38-1210(+)